MYCRLCDIEYPKSLRFCKWCGGGLVDREAVGTQHCPACGASVDREWLFCNECGVDLATLGAQPRDQVCVACSASVRKGWMFCRQCGEQVATERAGNRCDRCGAGVRANWHYCKQCGTSLTGTGSRTRAEFATVAGIPALPPESDPETETTFSDLRSGELPPLDDVIAAERRRKSGVGKPRPTGAPPSDAQPASGTHPLIKTRTTGPLDERALRSEIESRPAEQPPTTGGMGSPRVQPPSPATPPTPPQATISYPSPVPPGPAVGPVISGRLEASELIGSSRGSASAAEPATPQPQPQPQPQTSAPGLQETQVFSSPVQPAAPPPAPPAPPAATEPHAQPRTPATVTTAGPGQVAAQQPQYPPPAPPPVVATQHIPGLPTGGYPAPSPAAPPAPPAAAYEPQSYGQQPASQFGQPTLRETSAPSAPYPGYQGQPEQVPPTSEAVAKPGGSGLKWVAIAVAALAVVGGGSVGAFYAYKHFVTPAEVTGPPAPVNPEPAPAPAPAPPAAPVPPEGMVYVAGATIQLGSDDPGADDYSKPAHAVPVKAFFVDKTEVTNAEYKKFVDATGHAAPSKGWVGGAPAPGTENQPVVYVTWKDAGDYAAWAGKRLPTEAEWELAARGTDGRKYPWGSTWGAGRGNFSGAKGKIADVGSAPSGASPSGALDMLGNVWEWTASEYSLYPGSTAKDDPKSKGMIVIRGGGYEATDKVDATYRGFWKREDPGPQLGFRCVKDAP